jgi:hypothetical protein
LQFANGQHCLLGAQGNFSIAKPSFSGFDNCSSGVGFVWSSPVLQANMQWGVTVQSAYDGSVGVTQLIDGTNLCCNTGGEFQLDQGSTNLLGQTYSATNPATHTARFLYARNSTASPAVNLTATFKDYLCFRPAGNASNIWVTLGTNSWSMDGATFSRPAPWSRALSSPPGVLAMGRSAGRSKPHAAPGRESQVPLPCGPRRPGSH